MIKFVQISAVLMLLSAGGCAQTRVVNTAQVYDPVTAVQEYTQRADAVTLSAGNAQEVNGRIQIIDPWPRYVGDSRIPANGDRMADAVYRYRCNKAAPPPLPSQSTSGQFGVGGLAGAATAASSDPGGGCAGAQGQGAGNVR